MQRRRNAQTLFDATHRALQRAGLAWRMAALVLLLLLAGGRVAHAIVIDGDPPPSGCADGISGSLSATPSFIDRATSASVRVTLTWAVQVSPYCTMSLGLYLSGVKQPVGRMGTLSFDLLHTTTYALKALLWPGQPTLATTTVTVIGDPGVITVSAGPEITLQDLSKFDAHWMQPAQRQVAYERAYWNLYQRNVSIVWEAGERMTTLVRMYELTHDTRYLDHLHQFTEAALMFRDDHHPGDIYATGEDLPVPARDEIRGQTGLPGWGGSSLITARRHVVDEVSFHYAYPIAAFARLVAEHPELYGRYGADAVRYANESITTVRMFLPQLTFRQAGAFTEATLKTLDVFRTTPTDAQCEEAYEQALVDDPTADNATMKRYCLDLSKLAGFPMAHNWNFAFMRVLIELWRVLDNPWYQHAPGADPTAGPLRAQIPVIVSRLQRYFVNRLETMTESGGASPRFFWHYNDDLPAGFSSDPEDASHGSLDIDGLWVLHRNFVRLNAAATAAGEPIPLASGDLRKFAQTFLRKIAGGSNFTDDVHGDPASPADHRNSACDGWLHLTEADVQVYHVCREMSLRVVNGTQPYLTMSNHAALLLNKPWLPTVPPPPPPPPSSCRRGWTCCEPTPEGGCDLCMPRAAQCP